MINAHKITELHASANEHWHRPEQPTPAPESPFDSLVLEQHKANFDLWHREDAARDLKASDADIAIVKRDIDRLNQLRNDLAERLDLMLMEAIGEQAQDAALHSETPGMMIDRLSILSLKIFHTHEETVRIDADEAHRERNRRRLSVLTEQTGDLEGCLAELWAEIKAGRRRFKLYRQMKMYNDPSLNPVLYAQQKQAVSS